MSQNKLTTFVHNNLILTLVITLLVGGGLSTLAFSAYNSGAKSVQSNTSSSSSIISSSYLDKSSSISSSILSSSIISSSSVVEIKKEVVKEVPKTVEVEKPKAVEEIKKTIYSQDSQIEKIDSLTKFQTFEPKEPSYWESYSAGKSIDQCNNPVEDGYNYHVGYNYHTTFKDFFELSTFFIQDNNSSKNTERKHFDNINTFLKYGLVDVFTISQAFSFNCSSFYITKIKDLDFKVKNVDESRAMLTKQAGGYRLDVVGRKSNSYFHLNSRIPLGGDTMQQYGRSCINQPDEQDCNEKLIFTEKNTEIAIQKSQELIQRFEDSFNY